MNEMNENDAISFLLLYKGALAALNARGSLIFCFCLGNIISVNPKCYFLVCFDLQFYTSYDNICFSPDDSQVFVSYGKDVVIFNVAEGSKVDEFKKVYNYEVGRACFSPRGKS